jgi:hypothetical protein
MTRWGREFVERRPSWPGAACIIAVGRRKGARLCGHYIRAWSWRRSFQGKSVISNITSRP